MMKIVTDTHTRRNEATYRSALPPLTHKDAETVIKVLEKSLPLAESLIATNIK
jgi:HEPN domain-containing protein